MRENEIYVQKHLPGHPLAVYNLTNPIEGLKLSGELIPANDFAATPIAQGE